MFVGFLLFKPDFVRVDMALYSWSAVWRTYVQGFEVFLVDLVLLAIYIGLPRQRQTVPFLFPIGLYVFAALIATFQANVTMPSVFYVWQLLRITFAYVVITRACADERVIPAILKGMAIGLCVQAGYSVYERFALGVLQAGGSYGNQNLLGMMSHFAILPAFALLLAGQRGALPFITALCGAILTVLTTSRATVGLAAIGYFAIFALSILRGWTSRKVLVAMFAVACLAVLLPLALSSFEQRAAQNPVSDSEFTFVDDSRTAMERAAGLILADHPMGIGPNQYQVVANIDGYNTRAGVNWFDAASNVHNVYWLVAAETGYLGLVAWIIMLLRPLGVALVCGWSNRKDWRGDLLLGLAVALVIAYVHSYYEWSMVTANRPISVRCHDRIGGRFSAAAGILAGLPRC